MSEHDASIGRALESAALSARRGDFAAAWRVVGPMVEPKGAGWTSAEALILAAGVLLELGEAARALYLADRAALVGSEGSAATAHAVIGDIRRRQGRPRDAERSYRRALVHQPGHPAASVNLARLLTSDTPPRLVEAEELLSVVVDADARMLPAACNLAVVRSEQGRSGDAVRGLRRALEGFGAQAGSSLNPLMRRAWGVLAMLSQYDDGSDARAVARAHSNAAACTGVGGPLDQPSSERGMGSVVVVGLLSADFHEHPVTRFVRPWLGELGKHGFLVVGIDIGAPGGADARTALCRDACGAWIDARGLPDEVVVSQIRAAKVDVLIDLGGLTAGARPQLLDRRPAPVQLTAIGYPGDTGHPAVDGFLTDSIADPPDGAGPGSTGGMAVRLDPCAWCVEPPDGAPDPGELPAGPAVFASFNALAKVTPTCLAMWARVLAAVPGARLLIKAQGLDDPRVASALAQRAKGLGVDPHRLDLYGRDRDSRAHLGRYRGVHVALDTFPYHGTTTTCEALWMGVPVVSLAGDRHASRVGVSLLRAVGEASLIANSPDEYVSIAAGLALDTARLTGLRATLRARVQDGVLGDRAGYAARLAGVLHQVVNAGVRGAQSRG